MNELETRLAQTLRDDELDRQAPTAEEIMRGVRPGAVHGVRGAHPGRAGGRAWSWPAVLAAGLAAAAVIVAAAVVGPRLLGGDPVDPTRGGPGYTGLEDGTPAKALADMLQAGTDGLGPWQRGYADRLRWAYPLCLLGSPPAPGPVREAGQTLVSPGGETEWEAMAGSLVMQFASPSVARRNVSSIAQGLLRCPGDVGLSRLASSDGRAHGVTTELRYPAPPGHTQHVWAARWRDRVAILGLTVPTTVSLDEQRVFDALADLVRDDVALAPERRKHLTGPD